MSTDIKVAPHPEVPSWSWGPDAASAPPPPPRSRRRLPRALRGWRRAVPGVVMLVLALNVALLWADNLSLRHQQQTAAADQARRAAGLDGRIGGAASALQALDDRVTTQGLRLGRIPDVTALLASIQGSVWEIDTAEGLGTGFVLQSQGSQSTLVTNYHVVAGADAAHQPVQVVNGDRTLSGRISRVDRDQDLALVTVNATLPVLPMSSTTPTVGEAVLVVGSSLGLENSASTGIVAALRVEDGHSLIQMTAPISPGNSGGPVIDALGRVIGVTELKLVSNGAEALSFAIPLRTLCASPSVSIC